MRCPQALPSETMLSIVGFARLKKIHLCTQMLASWSSNIYVRFEASLRDLKKFASTMLASWFSNKNVWFEASLRDLKQGGWGGTASPICAHAASIMVFQHMCVRSKLTRLKKAAGWGAQPPSICTHTMLVAWFSNTYVCFKACTTHSAGITVFQHT